MTTIYGWYYAEKQNDGTYYILWTWGGNSEVELTGVRGCNVSRTIDRLNAEKMTKEV